MLPGMSCAAVLSNSSYIHLIGGGMSSSIDPPGKQSRTAILKAMLNWIVPNNGRSRLNGTHKNTSLVNTFFIDIKKLLYQCLAQATVAAALSISSWFSPQPTVLLRLRPAMSAYTQPISSRSWGPPGFNSYLMRGLDRMTPVQQIRTPFTKCYAVVVYFLEYRKIHFGWFGRCKYLQLHPWSSSVSVMLWLTSTDLFQGSRPIPGRQI